MTRGHSRARYGPPCGLRRDRTRARVHKAVTRRRTMATNQQPLGRCDAVPRAICDHGQEVIRRPLARVPLRGRVVAAVCRDRARRRALARREASKAPMVRRPSRRVRRIFQPDPAVIMLPGMCQRSKLPDRGIGRVDLPREAPAKKIFFPARGLC